MRTRNILSALAIFALASQMPHASAAKDLELPQQAAKWVTEHCLDCHDSVSSKGELNLEQVLQSNPSHELSSWEKVIRRLRARQMPPPGKARPSEKSYQETLTILEGSLAAWAEAHPDPGPSPGIRRLTRFEYQNAIRDLLDVDLDAAKFLPPDESSHGFDNITVGDLSPTLLQRYIKAARHVTRLALGDEDFLLGETYRTRPDLTQDYHLEGMPLGTRGGLLIQQTFPRDGLYEFQIRLTRDRNEHVEGFHGRALLDILIDRQPAHRFILRPPGKGLAHQDVDRHLKVQIPVQAGNRSIAITFPAEGRPALETGRQPFMAHYNMHRHPRLNPAVYEASITGPFGESSPGSARSRKRVLGEASHSNEPGEPQARVQLDRLLTIAYRRPATTQDLDRVLLFYREGAKAAGFAGGMREALVAILVSPRFLFRIESPAPSENKGPIQRLPALDLASRLSFFLWSSLPDATLLNHASTGQLHSREVLQQEVQRMLQNPKADALIHNFASQWLYLRNLDSLTPDLRLFPDFDDNLREAFRRETELLLETVIREDRSVLDLLSADFTFVNERLAAHYGIPHIQGSEFQRITLSPDSHRGGILRHGSILTLTSYATRTSPVIRGNWILKNLIGTPPPPPPPNVPDLAETTVDASLSVRDRLAVHRENRVCASCHNLMDPVGLALEQYDAVGRWREREAGAVVDASGGLPDGSTFNGIQGLEKALLARPEILVGTLAEKLLVYALGRGLEPTDGPAIRRIVQESSQSGYSFSALLCAIVESTPFQYVRVP